MGLTKLPTYIILYIMVVCRSEPYLSMKLMFVGVSNIGKSTLLGKLKGESSAAKGWNERRDTKKTPSMFHSILYDL